MTDHGYPKAVVDLAHTSVRCFLENKHLEGFLSGLNEKTPILDSARTELTGWLSMWTEYGMLMRVGGLSDVFSRCPFKPDPEPENLMESLRRTRESNSALLQLLEVTGNKSDKTEHPLTKFITKLGTLKQTLNDLSDYLGKNPRNS